MSDKGSRGEREDLSGQAIKDTVESLGVVKYYKIVPDEREEIEKELIYMTDTLGLDLILTSGGTGFGERDVTPEATQAVIERAVPGIPAAILHYSLKKTSRAMLSRAVAGIRKRSLIVNLPGSPRAVTESLEAILDALPHGLEVLTGRTSECARTEK